MDVVKELFRSNIFYYVRESDLTIAGGIFIITTKEISFTPSSNENDLTVTINMSDVEQAKRWGVNVNGFSIWLTSHTVDKYPHRYNFLTPKFNYSLIIDIINNHKGS